MFLFLFSILDTFFHDIKKIGNMDPQSAKDPDGIVYQSGIIIEEVWRQKARQNVGVLDWGARLNATLEIFGVIV